MNGTFHGRVSMRGTRFGRGVLFGSFGASSAPVGTKPTDITLSASSILETALPNTIVATINSNGDAPWLFSIIDDPDSKFRIVGSNLVLDQHLDYETATSHKVTIRAANLAGFHDKELTISVINVVEAVAPTVVDLSTTSVLESAGVGSVVAAISSDGTDPVTYSIESDPDGKFRIEGSNLVLDQALDFETETEHSVTIRATNAADFVLGVFTISVTDVVEAVAPTIVNLSSTSVSENTSVGAVVATISSDGTAPVTYALTSNPDGKFRIEGSNLVLDQALDFETDIEHAITIRATNAVDSADGAFTISVTDVVEAVEPTVVNLSMTSVLETAGIGAVVATISSDGTAPVTYTIENDPDDKFAINGNALELAATIDFATDTEHPVTIRATNAAGFELGAFTITVTQFTAPTAVNIGPDPDQDEGTNFDWYVDNVNGDNDTNDGLSVGAAFASVGAAISVAQPGDTIGVRNQGQDYNEFIALIDGITISGFGTEKPVFSGSVPLTGAVPCTAADESRIGPRYAEVYKVTNFPKTNFVDDDPFNAHLIEGERQMMIAMGRNPNSVYRNIESYNPDWLNADITNTVVETDPDLNNGAGGLVNRIVSHTFSGLSAYTQAQIEQCDIRFHREPNGASRYPVASFDELTNTVTFDRSEITEIWEPKYETNQYKDRFALVNLAPAIQKGEWCFWDNGDGTVDVFYWPMDAANVNTAIQYSNMDTVIDGRNVENWTMRSFVVQNTAGTQRVGTNVPIRADASIGSPNLGPFTLSNFEVLRSYSKGDGYGAFYARGHDGYLIEKFRVEDIRNAFGFFSTGGHFSESPEGPTRNGKITGFIVNRADKSPVRIYGNFDNEISRAYLINSGLAAHANKFNHYNGGHNTLWADIVVFGCSGYITLQETSAQTFFRIWATTNFSDSRAWVDQNKGNALSWATDQGVNGDCRIINCDFPATQNAVDAAAFNAMIVGQTFETEVLYGVMNSLFYGDNGTEATMLIPDGWKNNVYSGGTKRDASDTEIAYSLIYGDVSVGDFSIRADSPTRALAGHSLTLIPGADGPVSLEALWPDYDFTKDINGDTWSMANPPVGPVVNPDNFPDFEPVWVERPVISGAPVVGNELSVSDGIYVSIKNYVAPTHQWVRVADPYAHPDEWVEIPGETGNAYTGQGADVGSFLGVKSTVGGVQTQVVFTTPVQAVFPVETPTVLHEYADSDTTAAAGQWIETDSFTPSGKPLIVVVSTLNTPLSDNPVTATLGASGRTNGAGASVAFESTFLRRTRNQSVVAIVDDPGTDPVTLQFQTASGHSAVHVAFLETDGVTGLVAAEEVSATSVSQQAPSITTGSENSGVLHIVNRYDGDTVGNPIAWAGATEILESNTGGVDGSQDLAIGMAYEQAVPTQEYGATCSWPGSNTVAAFSVELVSGGGGGTSTTTDIMDGIGDFSSDAGWDLEAGVSISGGTLNFNTVSSFRGAQRDTSNRVPCPENTTLSLEFEVTSFTAAGNRFWINVEPFNSAGVSLGSSVTIYDTDGSLDDPEITGTGIYSKADLWTSPAGTASIDISIEPVSSGAQWSMDNFKLTY